MKISYCVILLALSRPNVREGRIQRVGVRELREMERRGGGTDIVRGIERRRRRERGRERQRENEGSHLHVGLVCK